MSDNDEHGRGALNAAVDATIIAVRRMFYVLGTDIDRSEGPIEFTFHDGSTLLLDAGLDGEELRIGVAPWRDPFEPLVDPVNIEYVAASGKYTAFDVTDEDPYVVLTGARVEAVSVISLADGRPRAATLYLTGGMVKVETVADELLVTLA
ncbi:hypothetical protein [Nocardia sp. SSK8]|uniref:hypothetical protein n=1 Tax=Nocardia sp. SSK8 TaxID=3120154 RepID=UPI003007F9D8